MKLCHQQRAQLNNYNQGSDFFSGEKNIYHLIGNGNHEFDTILRKTGSAFKNIEGDGNVDEPMRWVKTAFA